MRDADGFVLCNHGRPIRCLECGDEYEAELSCGVDGGQSAQPGTDMPANPHSSSLIASAEARGEARGRIQGLREAAARFEHSDSEVWRNTEVRDWLLFHADKIEQEQLSRKPNGDV